MNITAFHISQADLLGYIAAGFVFATFWMKTMVPLRVLGLISNIGFIAYGYLARAYPPLLLHVFLLPLNIVRLREMTQLIKQVEKAASGDLNMEWIKPFMSSRRMNAGEVLFRKGETANCLFFVVSGRCRLIETGIDLAPGAVVGEFALISADKTRTQTLQCTESGELLEIIWASQAALLPESDIWILLPSAHQWPTIREYQAARIGGRSVARAISCTISRIADCTGVNAFRRGLRRSPNTSW